MRDKFNLAPICLFVYSRLDETIRTVESLQHNDLVEQSSLYIFSDGPRTDSDVPKIQEVRKYIHNITGFASVTIFESEGNKGLANSIISGVSQIVNEFGKVIVLEDDLVLSTNFLIFMNDALTFYEDKQRVMSISGYSFDLKYPSNYTSDVAFSLRFASWGWATWKDRWAKVDWEVKDISYFKWNVFKQIKFTLGGSDLCRMLFRQVHGKIDSWAIRFAYHQYKYGLLDVFPVKSKVVNIGFTSQATHTKSISARFKNVIDNTGKTNFVFLNKIKINWIIVAQFYKHYSFINRLKDKFKTVAWIINKS